MKEAKDARYTNGHLFTTISVSGMTMCYACNKSITAKEALICPSKLDPECHSDSHLPICPFCSGSIGVTLHSEPQLGPNARARCLLPCSLSSHRGVVAVGLWHKKDYLGGRGRGDEDGSQCSCRPLGVPGSLNSWGTDWSRSRNACEGRWGQARGAWWQVTELAAGSANLLGRTGRSGLRGPLATPFLWTVSGA